MEHDSNHHKEGEKMKHQEGHEGHHHEPEQQAGHGHHGHGDHHRMMIRDFKKRFWISLALTVPVVLFSHMIQEILGYHIEFTGMDYLVFVLSSIIYFYGGWPFLKGTVDELKGKSPGMMTLIGLAISVAYLYSSAVVFGLEGEMFFWELATLIVIMLLGHWLEMKSVLGASRALEMLVKMMPSEATRLTGDSTEKVSIDQLQKGDKVIVKPGEKIPVDGTVQKGKSYVNESMLTGESKPVEKKEGMKVIAGAINQNGSLTIEVGAVGKESYISKVIELVENAQKNKSSTQRLADKAAFWLTVIALTAGAITLTAWLVAGREFDFALERMVTVMIISCPHALGLAIPLVVAISTAISARNGLLIRNRTAFENSRKITMIIFDKTGTLTKGSHEVTRIVPLNEDWDESEVLKMAAAAEQGSEHHIAKGLLEKAKKESLKIPGSEDFDYTPGVGVKAVVEGKNIQVGGPGLLKKLGKQPKEDENNAAETIIYVLSEGEVVGYISFADQIRESSYEAIKTLHENDIKTLLLTGDEEIVAKAVADELGMGQYIAGVLPHEKQEKVKELQTQGEFVAMAGDGVNDAPALAQADVGIAVGSGTDIAAETADIILVESDPKDVTHLILFGKATYKKMVQNLVYATAYNAVAIPLAAGVLFWAGIMISPALGAALMSLSTIVVAFNAQLLKRKMKREK